jgi:hypothetical protein
MFRKDAPGGAPSNPVTLPSELRKSVIFDRKSSDIEISMSDRVH